MKIVMVPTNQFIMKIQYLILKSKFNDQLILMFMQQLVLTLLFFNK